MEDTSHTCSNNVLLCILSESQSYLLICLLISQLAHFPHLLVLLIAVLGLLLSTLDGAGVGLDEDEDEGPKNFIKLEMSSVSSS